MIIKICGMRDPENIRAVSTLDIDMMGFVFSPASQRFVRMISSGVGIVPDYSEERLKTSSRGCEGSKQTIGRSIKRVGVFADDMPQNIITRVYNYQLDYIQLHGDEPRTTCENLRSTIDPDIRPGIKIIKTIRVRTEDDLKKCSEYEKAVDLFLFYTRSKASEEGKSYFNPARLTHYEGETPFLLGGGIAPDDIETILRFKHPRFMGIDLNRCFETAPAVKDVEKLRNFISKIRQNGE